MLRPNSRPAVLHLERRSSDRCDGGDSIKSSQVSGTRRQNASGCAASGDREVSCVWKTLRLAKHLQARSPIDNEELSPVNRMVFLANFFQFCKEKKTPTTSP